MIWILQQLPLTVICLATLVGTSHGHSDHWDYDHMGPTTWAHEHKKFCAGVKQSPIDLSVEHSVETTKLKEIAFFRSTNASTLTLKVKNDGHKLELSWLPSELVMQMGTSCGHMTHTAHHLHWHWGSDSNKGSEHTVDKKSFAAEGHLVFYNSADYENLTEAKNKPGGLAVLGVLFKASDHDNELFKLLEPALLKVENASSTAELTFDKDKFDLVALFLPQNRDDYFRYDGSLTTPPCYESVLWTVYHEPVPISQRQLKLLRALRFSGESQSAMVDNFRPPLKLNPTGSNRLVTPRTLHRSFRVANSPHGASSAHEHVGAAARQLPGLNLAAALATVAMLSQRLAALVSGN